MPKDHSKYLELQYDYMKTAFLSCIALIIALVFALGMVEGGAKSLIILLLVILASAALIFGIVFSNTYTALKEKYW